MMTSQQKAEKAREILRNDPSDEDRLIAVGLAQEAAADNNAMGLFLLGNCYLTAEGVEQDEQKAFNLCQKALDLGYEKAKRSLAILYIQGNVVEQNLPLAEQYLRDCMANDDEEAWLLMGQLVQHDDFPHISPTNASTITAKPPRWATNRLFGEWAKHTACAANRNRPNIGFRRQKRPA